jgi:hypothetical protein
MIPSEDKALAGVTEAPVFAQQIIGIFFGNMIFFEERDNTQSAVQLVAAAGENLVYDLLGNRKSGGCWRGSVTLCRFLRFTRQGELLCYRG